jgi:DNA-binding IclR family transcriptional regulator
VFTPVASISADTDERDGSTGRYRLGLELIALSGVVLGRTEVLRIADPHLRYLADQTQETVNLGIRHRNDILNIEQIPGPNLLRSFDWIGKRTPLHLGAAAKALLANLGDEEIWAYLAASEGSERRLADLFAEAQRERLRQTPLDEQRAQVEALEQQLQRMKRSPSDTDG